MARWLTITPTNAGVGEEMGIMKRERALKAVLVIVGLLFVAGIYPLVTIMRSALKAHEENATPMMLSLYVTLGVFLLSAARTPSANRSVIAFAAWSSFAHALVMAVMSVEVPSQRAELLMAAAAFSIIGALLVVLGPEKGTSAPGHAIA